MENQVQVNKEHYNFLSYCSKERWASYYEQVKNVLDSIINEKESKILIIGDGDGIVKEILARAFKSQNQKVQIDTFDFDASLNPTYVGDVREIDKLIEVKYDIVLCCQVLEHLEFNNFDNIINRITKITKRLILSLPSRSINIRFCIGLKPLLVKKIIPISRPTKYKFNGEHYWEMNTKGYSKRKVNAVIKKHCEIKKQYRLFENPYHYFWILDSKY